MNLLKTVLTCVSFIVPTLSLGVEILRNRVLENYCTVNESINRSRLGIDMYG